MELETATEKSNVKSDEVMDKDAISQKLEQIYKRLEFIDADSAESRAASILAVSYQTSVVLVTLESSCITSI